MRRAMIITWTAAGRADPASGVPPACTDLSCPFGACDLECGMRNEFNSPFRIPHSFRAVTTQHGRGEPRLRGRPRSWAATGREK